MLLLLHLFGELVLMGKSFIVFEVAVDLGVIVDFELLELLDDELTG